MDDEFWRALAGLFDGGPGWYRLEVGPFQEDATAMVLFRGELTESGCKQEKALVDVRASRRVVLDAVTAAALEERQWRDRRKAEAA